MNDQQQSFLPSVLAASGIRIDEQNHSVTDSSGVHMTAADNFIAPLSHYGFLQIAGPDTAKFLQGQTTCDIGTVNHALSRAGAYTTPKGRMISSFQLAQTQADTYLLRMHADIVESTKAVFSKYIVFSKAEQQNASPDYIAIGLCGERAKATIHQVFTRCPDQAHQVINHQGNLAIQIDTAGRLYECWIKTAELATLWPLLNKGLELQGSRQWQLQLIQLGLGEVSANTVDSFIPQMLNYQITGAVSFTKGCYTGQEVIARLQYKGKLKRSMYRIKVAVEALAAGTDLYGDDKQSIGNIVNSVSLDNHHSEALAVIASKAVDQESVVVGSDRATIQLLPLPYALNNDD